MANITINRINIIINPADLGIINTSITQTGTQLNPYTESLSPDEREELFSLSVNNKIFADEAFDEATTNGGILPNFIPVPDLGNDIMLFEQMETIETQLENLLQRVRDTKRLAGHEAYAMSLTIYKLYESAHLAGIAGATASYERLRIRFQNGGGAPTTGNPHPPTSPTTPTPPQP